MDAEILKKGNELQGKIKSIKFLIKLLEQEHPTAFKLGEAVYEFMNMDPSYKDLILKTAESCQARLEREFENL
jgi:hypothetical protein